jgi:hypothetical protein
MISRYANRAKRINKDEGYDDWFKSRKTNSILQYMSAKLVYPTEEQMEKLNIVAHIWQNGDMFYKLADVYYNEPKYWWLIAWFNQKPTEAHVQFGEKIFIVTNHEQLIKIMGI